MGSIRRPESHAPGWKFDFGSALLSAVLLLVVAVVFVVFLILALIVFPFYWVYSIPDRHRLKRFLKEYREYMNEIDGTEFFCYTNRKTSKPYVESNILPMLDDGLEVVMLEGRKLHSEYDPRFLLHGIDRLPPKTVPGLLKVSDGELIGISLHSELYETIHGKRSLESFLKTVGAGRRELRSKNVIQSVNRREEQAD